MGVVELDTRSPERLVMYRCVERLEAHAGKAAAGVTLTQLSGQQHALDVCLYPADCDAWMAGALRLPGEWTVRNMVDSWMRGLLAAYCARLEQHYLRVVGYGDYSARLDGTFEPRMLYTDRITVGVTPR